MKRLAFKLRDNWQKRLEEIGFSYHSVGGSYWNEGICYEFTSDQIDYIENTTEKLYAMCLEAVDFIISNNLFGRIGVNEQVAEYIKRSWVRKDLSLYGRFDFSYDGRSDIKLLEFNADTPTSLFESSIVQWLWLEDVLPEQDQFNSIHEKLIDAFADVKRGMPIFSILHFTCAKDSEEDIVTTEYMRDAAKQVGIPTKHIFIEDIGYNIDAKSFCDLEGDGMRYTFKLYPWEWIVREEFGKYVLSGNTVWYEPAWKLLLSNKGILPILWEMYPGHPNLLSSYFDDSSLDSYVRKPIFSREGANILMLNGQKKLKGPEGNYGMEGHVYQAIKELPCFDGHYAVIGSWVVNGEAAGIGVREDDTPITKNTSKFVPHYFKN